MTSGVVCREKLLKASPFEADGGESIGRDPRDMSAEDLTEAGKPRVSVLKAVRAKCLDCCGQVLSEVAKCTAVDCALWAFRMNSNPYRKEMSEEQRQAASERFTAMRQARATDDEG